MTSRLRLVAATAAAVTIVAVGSLVAFLLGRTPDARLMAIAQEVALNHNKALDLEFHAQRVADLQGMMPKLDFVLIEPARIAHGELKLRGARYCSIQGELAAQLRFSDPDGRVHTLYEAKPVEGLRPPRGSLPVLGLSVELWQEAGLLLGLASPPEYPPPRQ
jgi:hypothetical protein